jgi:hypothetical protein
MNHLNPTPEMLSAGCDFQKEVGDIVQLGTNTGPDFRILAIVDDQAWIRSIMANGYGGEAIVALDRLRWIRKPATLALAA